MKTLRECIQEAEEKKVALGHFNISNMETLWGIFHAAHTLNVPVIIGLSEGEGAFFGVKQARAIVDSIKEEFNYPIYLNADHSYTFERFKETVDARFDSAIIDRAKLTFPENVAETKKCVSYARSVDPEIIVEGELGYIGTSSNVFDVVPEGVTAENMTKPEEAKTFVDQTGVDLFAPSVGNIHGMLRNMPNPRLDIERIKNIHREAGVPLVLHGGSGISDADFKAAIEAGISIVHINTEIRVGFRKGLEEGLREMDKEVAPYKFMGRAALQVEQIVLARLKLFNNL